MGTLKFGHDASWGHFCVHVCSGENAVLETLRHGMCSPEWTLARLWPLLLSGQPVRTPLDDDGYE